MYLKGILTYDFIMMTIKFLCKKKNTVLALSVENLALLSIRFFAPIRLTLRYAKGRKKNHPLKVILLN